MKKIKDKLSNKDIILIAGCPRSGTTSMVQLLNKNRLLITNEWSIFGYPEISDGMGIKEFLTNKQNVINNSDLSSWLQSYSSLVMTLPQIDTELDYVNIVDDIYMNLDCYGDKWRYELIMDSVVKKFPTSSVIYMYRHPIPTVMSMLKAKMVSSLSEGFDVWLESIESWLRWRDYINHIAIKQESLAFNIDDVCIEISKFLNKKIYPYSLFDDTYESYSDFKDRLVNHKSFYDIASYSDIPHRCVNLAKKIGYEI